MVMIGLWLILAWLFAWWRANRHCIGRKNTTPTLIAIAPATHPRNRRKPAWVIAEVLRLKALCAELSCRTLAEIFNRRFAIEQQMTVSKTYVASTLHKHNAELLLLRREIRHRVPPAMPNNQVWALDLTGKADLTGRQQIILGVIDHGSRACLRLQQIADKSSLTILQHLVDTFRRDGIPKAIRTDNETCFTSRTMRWALRLLGIRHQTTEPCCPWQNGRIERLFGTLKAKLDRIRIVDANDLRCKLIEFRAWYNHVRPHQHLDGRTPAEAWERRRKSYRTPTFFEAWDGLLRGWHFPP